MNTKAVAIGAVAAVAVAAGGYVIADRTADARAHSLLERHAASLGTGEHFTWAAVDASPLGGSVAIDGLTYSRADGYQARSATVRASGLSEAGVETARAEDVTISLPGSGTVTIAAMDIAAVGPVADLPPDSVFAGERLPAVIGGLTAKSIAVSDLTFTAEDGSVRATVKGMGVDDVVNGRYGRIAMSGLELTETTAEAGDGGGGLALSLTDLSLSGLDLSSLRGDMTAIEAAAGDAFGLTELRQGRLTLTGFSPDGPISLDGLSITDLERIEGTVVSSRLRMDHLTVPASLLAPEAPLLAMALEALDRKALDLSVDIAQRYIAEGGALTVGPVSVRGEGLGEAVLKVDFAGVPLVELARAMDADDLEAAMAMAGNIAFVGATLTYSDDRLADVLVDQAAGGDRPGFAAAAAEMVTLNAGDQVSPADVAMVADAVRAFLVGTTAFSISLTPQQPLLLPVVMESAETGGLTDLLTLKVEGS